MTRYYCPASREIEDDEHGGFDVCCDRPHEHVMPPSAAELDAARAVRAWELHEAAERLSADSSIRSTQLAWLYYPDHMAAKARVLRYAAQRLHHQAERIAKGEEP